MNKKRTPQVVIVGGGFGGLYAARYLGKANLQVTLVDRRNFHLFQPLLYQVATGGLSPEDISSPLRAILSNLRNVAVKMDEVVDINPKEKLVNLRGESIPYDYLILATGSQHHYFGRPDWEGYAPGLKTIEDALEIRNRVLNAFESAEREQDETKRKALLRFVLVGAGPTGVELAGALAELSQHTLKDDFRSIDPSDSEIILVEGMDRVLPTYPQNLSKKAQAELEALGVKIRTTCKVSELQPGWIELSNGDEREVIEAQSVLWAAGVKASPLTQEIAKRTNLVTDRLGRLPVEKDLSLSGFPEILAIGDMAAFRENEGTILPGVASVAMQQGRHAAINIQRMVSGRAPKPFRFRNPGTMAVIGRNAAVADLNFLNFSGFLAWLLWVFVHIVYLIEFGNKLVVMAQWGWNYLTRKKGARLIGRTTSLHRASFRNRYERLGSRSTDRSALFHHQQLSHSEIRETGEPTAEAS
jgi:NADH dehydrogenase